MFYGLSLASTPLSIYCSFYRLHATPEFDLWNGQAPYVVTTSGTPLTIGTTYIFKYQVETISGANQYSFKVWKQGDPEPSAWLLTGQEAASADLSSGSLLLIAHELDAIFGNISVSPLP